MADARQFRLEMDKMAQAIEQIAVDHQKRVVGELFTAVNLANPVGNPSRWKRPRRGYVGGQSRRNWRLSLLAPDRSTKPGVDPSGSQSQGEAFAILSRLRTPTRMWLSNPLDYMEPLERGWSKQAPNGVLGPAAQAIARKYGLRLR